MSNAPIFSESNTFWKIRNLKELGVPQLLNNIIDEKTVRAIGDIEKVTAGEGGWRTIVWGRVRPIGGNTIFASKPVSYWMEEQNEGKGNADDNVTLVEHIFRTYAIGICEGPITRVTRVWRNNKLVYDARGNAWGAFNNATFLRNVRFYDGSFDQMPDSALEAVAGAGEVPAFRGTAYMVVFFEDLTENMGSIPQFQFEVEKVENTLIDTLARLGATEIWLHDDESGGVKALINPSNNLEEIDGSNFVYRQESKCFPGTYMIDASDQVGANSFFATTTPATLLQTTGDCSVVSIGSASGSYNHNNAPCEGLASATNIDEDDNCLFKFSPYAVDDNRLLSRVGHEGEEATKGLISYNLYNGGSEFLTIATRDSSSKLYTLYANGEEANTYSYTNNPTGGANCLYIEGRDVDDLSKTVRLERFYGVKAFFKRKLSASEQKTITDAAFDFENRVGSVPDSYFNDQVWSGSTLQDGVCMVRSKNTDGQRSLGESSNIVGLVAYEIQMGTGKSIFTTVSGYTITGDTSTLNKGDIIKIECVADKEFVGTLYPSETA